MENGNFEFFFDWNKFNKSAEYATKCLICEKTIVIYNPTGNLMICDDCKKAVEWAKRKMRTDDDL